MSKQKFYRQEYKKLNPSWKDSLILYKELIEENSFADAKLLDMWSRRFLKRNL